MVSVPERVPCVLASTQNKYANTQIYIDSVIAVHIFVLDTPAECTLTSLRDVWLREVLKLHWLCVRINLKLLASSQNFRTLAAKPQRAFVTACRSFRRELRGDFTRRNICTFPHWARLRPLPQCSFQSVQHFPLRGVCLDFHIRQLSYAIE